MGYPDPALADRPADPQATHAGAVRRVGGVDVADLLSAAEDARRWDSRYGGGNWRSNAILDCLRDQAAPLLHGRYTDQTGRQLFSATAQLSRLAGWTAFDTGHHAAAQRHYIQALRMARAAADVPFGGGLPGQQYLLALGDGTDDYVTAVR